MTLIQIAAIISLLLAFGVDTPTVNTIDGILREPFVGVVSPVPAPQPQPTPATQPAPQLGTTASTTSAATTPLAEPVKPQLSNVSVGFYQEPGADIVINALSFTSTVEVACAGQYTKQCNIQDANKVRANISGCTGRLDKGFYVFEAGKTYSCDISAPGVPNYKHTFTVPN